MSSNNNNGEMMGFALVFAGVAIAALFLFALMAFVAAILTVLCLFAWTRPVTIFGETLTPEEARSFIGWGLVGAMGVPAFALFCAVLFGLRFDPGLWGYLLIGGYTLGALGYATHEAQEKGEAQGKTIDLIAAPPSAPSAPKVLPPPRRKAEPFAFASWDDEIGNDGERP